MVMKNWPGLRILIVEDHEDYRATVKEYLIRQKLNLEINDVGSAEAALIEAKRFRPDIILMDIRLPNMNGIEASGEIKKFLPECQIIILTVFETEAFREVFTSNDISAYLGKSELQEKLLPRIKSLVKARELELKVEVK